MATPITLFEVSAEGRGAARADVAKSFMLLWRDRVPPLRQELLLMFADDIGYFEPMFGHLRQIRRMPDRSSGWAGRIADGKSQSCGRRQSQYARRISRSCVENMT